MSIPLKIVLFLIAAYLAVVAIAYAAQRRLTYFPNTTRVPPSALGLKDTEEIEIPAPDGARIVGWYAKAPPGRPTLLYLHGNSGNLANRSLRFARYQNAGLGILMMSWRGYSGSTGSPTEADNIADARRAYDYLLARSIKPQDIVLYGESLGSGVAVAVALDVPVAGVALDAPYTSIAEIGAKAYPYLPVRLLMRDRYETDRRIAGLTVPLLILHGARDTVVPVTMGQRLYELAREPKKIMIFPNGHHSDLNNHGAAEVLSEWIGTLKRL
jgi:fermentation-respiration switch protein FrsA (DUF1100 family)